MKKIREFWHDTRADSLVVEATILFPIIIMIFAALVLLSMYLPQRAKLQEAAQVAAVTIATERSDTWVAFDDHANYSRKDGLPNVYVAAVRNAFFNQSVDEAKVTAIIRNNAAKGFVSISGDIIVDYDVINYVIYQEVVVTARQSIPMRQFGLSFIGFPDEMVIVQEARAVVQNGDEFVRNINIAKDMVIWIDNKLGISEGLKGALDKVKSTDIRSIFGF